MRFEVNLPQRLDYFAVRPAGVIVGSFVEVSEAVSDGKKTLPAAVPARLRQSDGRAKVSVTILSFATIGPVKTRRNKYGGTTMSARPVAGSGTRIAVEVSDARIGKEIRRTLNRYSVENKGEAFENREHRAVWAEINRILKGDKLSYDKLQQGQGPMPRRAIEALMKLCPTLEPIRRHNVHCLFDGRNVAKADRPLAAKWLMEEFETGWEDDDQLGVSIWELACPQIADDLIRCIKDPRFGDERWPLALAVAKTKHPEAAEAIAGLLGQGLNTRGAIEALGKLGAKDYIERIRKYLRDPDSDVRREAKKALKKLVAPVEIPPAPVHLVKGARLIPKGMEEWSSDQDMDDLVPTLQKLAKCVENGFGKTEIAEVIGVAEEMRVDQTKVFRFPIKAKGKKGELWVTIFMDDIDTPDLAIYAAADIISKFEKLA